MQVSDEGGAGRVQLGRERMSLGGRGSKAIPQRLEACNSGPGHQPTCQRFPAEARNPVNGASNLWV